MSDQLVRGFAYFPGRSLEEIRESFRNFNTNGPETRYFDGLVRYGDQIDAPGIFLSGKADWSLSSKDFVYLLRGRALSRAQSMRHLSRL